MRNVNLIELAENQNTCGHDTGNIYIWGGGGERGEGARLNYILQVHDSHTDLVCTTVCIPTSILILMLSKHGFQLNLKQPLLHIGTLYKCIFVN